MQACKLLEGLIPEKDDKDYIAVTRGYLERLYVFTLMWCIGAFLELDDRAKLEQFIRSSNFHLDLPVIPSGSEDTMFDYFVDHDG